MKHHAQRLALQSRAKCVPPIARRRSTRETTKNDLHQHRCDFISSIAHTATASRRVAIVFDCRGPPITVQNPQGLGPRNVFVLLKRRLLLDAAPCPAATIKCDLEDFFCQGRTFPWWLPSGKKTHRPPSRHAPRPSPCARSSPKPSSGTP